jgi:Preprotein translocase subunit Sec66
LNLPAEVEEYFTVKEQVIAAGWAPGTPPDKANPNGPHRVLAQALMKRAIGDVPIVTHIQKESAGMNKLYSQSMCSVKQWRAYQAAEAMVSAEVEEVRQEADEIEPGWSQVRGYMSVAVGETLGSNLNEKVCLFTGYLAAGDAIPYNAQAKA